MHGRLKVKTTEEQQEAKRKERERKLKIYNATTTKIFEKRKNGELDEEILMLTGELLSVNPDFYTLWNIRRELLQSWSSTKSEDEMTKVYDGELHFLEQCLRVNPKSYGTWHQRSWIMDRVNTAAKWTRELSLCSTFLEYDERNFHCWDYRRFVVDRARIKPSDELQFTTDKISANFSNFSSWHYRSRLLPLVNADPSHLTGVEEKTLLNEFELVQNAFFTDPNDQSAWFYHRWLLGQGLRRLSIVDIYLKKSDGMLIVTLTQPAQLGAEFELEFYIGDAREIIDWNPASGCSPSIFWVSKLADLEKHAENSFIVSLKVRPKEPGELEETNNKSSGCETKFELDANGCFWKNSTKSNFCNELSMATAETLNTELDSIRQLHLLEPDNKWVLLTMLSLMRALDSVKHLKEMTECIDKLPLIDPMRSNYYADLRSIILMESAINNHLRINSRSFVLSGVGLTIASHLEHLFTANSVNLSHNLLRDLGSVYGLQCVRELNVASNKLTSCRGIDRLSLLELLDIRDNDIEEVTELAPLSSCPRLHTAHITGNPVASQPAIYSQLPRFIKSLHTTET